MSTHAHAAWRMSGWSASGTTTPVTSGGWPIIPTCTSSTPAGPVLHDLGGSGEFDHVQEQVSHTVSPGVGGRGASVTGLDTLPDMRRVIRSSGNGASTGDLTDRE